MHPYLSHLAHQAGHRPHHMNLLVQICEQYLLRSKERLRQSKSRSPSRSHGHLRLICTRFPVCMPLYCTAWSILGVPVGASAVGDLFGGQCAECLVKRELTCRNATGQTEYYILYSERTNLDPKISCYHECSRSGACSAYLPLSRHAVSPVSALWGPHSLNKSAPFSFFFDDRFVS